MKKISRKARAKLGQDRARRREKGRKSAIKNAIKNLKPKRFSGQFVCDLCRHTRLTGYLYTTEDKDYEICKFCYDDLKNIKPHVKIIYTPMGNKR